MGYWDNVMRGAATQWNTIQEQDLKRDEMQQRKDQFDQTFGLQRDAQKRQFDKEDAVKKAYAEAMGQLSPVLEARKSWKPGENDDEVLQKIRPFYNQKVPDGYSLVDDGSGIYSLLDQKTGQVTGPGRSARMILDDAFNKNAAVTQQALQGAMFDAVSKALPHDPALMGQLNQMLQQQITNGFKGRELDQGDTKLGLMRDENNMKSPYYASAADENAAKAGLLRAQTNPDWWVKSHPKAPGATDGLKDPKAYQTAVADYNKYLQSDEYNAAMDSGDRKKIQAAERKLRDFTIAMQAAAGRPAQPRISPDERPATDKTVDPKYRQELIKLVRENNPNYDSLPQADKDALIDEALGRAPAALKPGAKASPKDQTPPAEMRPQGVGLGANNPSVNVYGTAQARASRQDELERIYYDNGSPRDKRAAAYEELKRMGAI